MKKKLFILVLAATICGSIFLGENAYADVTCTVAGSGITDKNYCASILLRSHSGLATYCKRGNSTFNEANCKAQARRWLICNNSVAVEACNASKTSYVNDLFVIFRDNNVDPCAGKSGSAETSCHCQNQQYYGSTGCGNSNNGGGGTNPSTPSSPSTNPSSDDSSDSDSTTVDVAPVNSGDCTSILPSEWCDGSNGIESIIRLIINILTGSIVVAGTVGIIICGVLWMTARENEGQVATAKKRMLDIVIGVVAWVLLALLANLFIPKSSSDIQGEVSVVTSKEVKA